MRDEKDKHIHPDEIRARYRTQTAVLAAKGRLMYAQAQQLKGARAKESTPQDTKDGLEKAFCINIAPGADGTTELTVYSPREQSITISNAELTFIINALIEREALIRHGR